MTGKETEKYKTRLKGFIGSTFQDGLLRKERLMVIELH